MRVLLLTDEDITHGADGYRVRVLSELTEATKRGIHFTVLSFQHMRHLSSFAGALEYSRLIRSLGCDVIVVWVFPHFSNRLLFRLVRSYKAFWLKRILKGFHVKLIHCHSCPEVAHLALMSKTHHHLPIVFDLHGAPEERSFLYHTRSKSIAEEAERVDKQVLRSAEAVVCVSSSLSRHVQTKFFARRTLVIPCAVDTRLFRFSSAHRDRLRSQWNLKDDQPVFVYSGGTQTYQQLDVMARLFREILGFLPSSKVLLLVPTSSRDAVEEMFRLAGVPSESLIVCSTDHWRVPAFLSAADIAFLIRENLLINRVASPTKFAEYLACGLPVVASPYVDSVRDAIRQGGVGFLLQGQIEDSIQQLSDFTKSVITNRAEWSKKCQMYARDYLSWDYYGDELVKLYASVNA